MESRAVTASVPSFGFTPPAKGVYPAAYALADLGEVDGLPLLPVALNDVGQVAVCAQPAEGQVKTTRIRGFLRTGDQLEECLATQGAPPLTGLSHFGMLCGQERSGPGPLRAWASHLGEIGAQHWPESESLAVAVNGGNEVAGCVVFENDGRLRRRVFLINAKDEAHFLPAPGGMSAIPAALNDAGTVLVNTASGFYEFHSQCLVWQRGAYRQVPGLEGGGIWGAALTQAGRIAGRLFTTLGGIRAFLHENGRTYDLNRRDGGQSEALALNDERVVVGRMMSRTGQRQAFRWTPADGMRALEEMVPHLQGWALQKAVAVNALGQIAGTGLRDGAPRGFVLTPAA